jgi:hypothetical protein
MSSTKHGNQFFVPGWGFLCLPETSQNNFFVAGFGFVNDSNQYQSPTTSPFLEGFPL